MRVELNVRDAAQFALQHPPGGALGQFFVVGGMQNKRIARTRFTGGNRPATVLPSQPFGAP
jgi:hypothetical protein